MPSSTHEECLRAIVETLAATMSERGGFCIAWSGGLDSTVLLDLTRRARRRTDDASASLAAVHVDHGLRAASRADAAHCRRLGRHLGIPVATARLDLPDDASQHQARRARYAALADHARRMDLPVVLTAHHADDAVETALLRMAEGAGGSAIASLAPNRWVADAPVAGWSELQLLRPLLRIPRRHLEAYARRRDLSWHEDPSNRSDDYKRNRVRRDLLPELTDLADSHAPLLRTLENLSDEGRAVEAWVDRLWDDARAADPHREALAFERDALEDVPEAVVAGLIRRAVDALPRPGRTSRAGLRSARHFITSRTDTPATVVLRGATVIIDADEVTVEVARGRGSRARNNRRAHSLELDLDAAPDGTLPWFDGRLAWRGIEPDDPMDFPRRPECTWFDADALPDRLVLRGPRPGEHFRALGMDGAKSVHDVLRDGDVPADRRWRWPCLATARDDDLLWVCGLRRASRGAVSRETSRVVAFHWHYHPE